MAWHRVADRVGVPNLEVVAEFQDDDLSEESLLKAISSAPRPRPLCVKPSHLTTGKGVFFLDPTTGRVSAPDPTGPGAKEMEEDLGHYGK